MKQLFSLFLILVCTFSAQAQPGNIKGNLHNAKDSSSIMGASIILYRSNDSAIVKAESTDHNGAFVLDNIPPGNYYLNISSIGFKSQSIKNIHLSEGKQLNIGAIQLLESATTLENVVVKATRPLIERKTDKLVFNIGSDISAPTSTALEMLEKAPGVTVDADGNISLKGKSGVVIMIDDRPTYMSASELTNYLKSLPASSLDQFEIMTNPSARYDAAGNSGIINIKTKKVKNQGFNGSFTTSVRVNNKFSNSENFNFNYRNGKINLFGNYSLSLQNFKQEQTILRLFRNPNTKNIDGRFDQLSFREGFNNSHNLRLGMDYYAGKNTIAGFVFTGNKSNDRTDFSSDSWFKDANNNPDSGLIATNRFDQKTNKFSGNLNVRHQFNSGKSSMTADLDYIVYDIPYTTTLITRYFLPDQSQYRPQTYLSGNIPALIKVYSGKTDFKFPIEKLGQIEAGLKASIVRTDNNAQYKNRIAGHDEDDLGKSNHFIYEENILAGYISWSKQIEKWSFQAGLRAENTHALGHQLGNAIVPDSSFTKDYVNLFPTAYISFAVDKNNQIGLNTGRRIQRPGYASLNPFLYYIDEYTYQAGNVYLQPQFTNVYEISHDFKSLIHSSISYSYTTDAITETLIPDAEKKVIYQTADNLATQKDLAFSSGIYLKTGKHLKTNLSAGVNYKSFEGKISDNYLVNTSGWMYMIKMSEQGSFGKGWSAGLDAFYISKQPYGQLHLGEMWRVDASLLKSVLKDKGSLSFSVRDIFNSQKFEVYTYGENLNIKSINQSSNPTFSVSFRYNFGKPIKGLKNYQSGSAADEQSRIGGK